MSRNSRHEWMLSGVRTSVGTAKGRNLGASSSPHSRRLRMEPLEDRRLLSITVNTLVDENNGIGVGGISLREAIAAAASGEIIDFSVTGEIQLAHGQLLINKSLTIQGPGAGLLTVRAHDPTPALLNGDGHRIFNIDDGNPAVRSTVTLSGLTLTRADVAGHGGAIALVQEDLNVVDSVITGNHATLTGGAISHYRGNVWIIGSTISGNTSNQGGGILHNQGQLTITGSTITGNTAIGKGGGIWADGSVELTDSTVSHNSTTGNDARGGGIFATGDVTLTDSSVHDNRTTQQDARGGGIFANGGVELIGSEVRDNRTDGLFAAGGGIFADGGVTLIASTLSGNRTTGNDAPGGGIFTWGPVTLTDSTVTGNSTAGTNGHGGGIWVYGAVNVTGSIVSGNSGLATGARGGGIFARLGDAEITRSTISGNAAFDGGGLASDGSVLIVESTFSDNTATFGGGVSHNPTGNLTIERSTFSGNTAVQGGGLLTETTLSGPSATAATILHSTFSGNRALAGGVGGAIFNGVGHLVIRHSTIASNNAPLNGGSGVATRGGANSRIEVYSSIVSGNLTGVVGGDVQVIDAGTNPFVSLGYNLVGHGNGAAGKFSAATNDIFSSNVLIDPQLGPLTNNGGPTQTHALLLGGPAINSGDSSILFDPAEHDQRGAGFLRVQFGRIDIGAYEFFTEFPAQGLVVDFTGDEVVDNDFTVGNLNLIEAIGLANLYPGDDTITFDTALSGRRISPLFGRELTITETLTIDATALAQPVTIDGGGVLRIFDITATTGDFTLAGLTLTGGWPRGNFFNPFDDNGSGGAIRSLTSGNLILDQSTVSGNRTSEVSAHAPDPSGGGIRAGGNVTLTNSTVSGNVSSGSSGGIGAGGNVTLTNSTVSGNSATSGGGGIRANGTVTLTQSTVSGNSTTANNAHGGGIWANGTVTLTQSTVSGNRTMGANSRGGGISGEGIIAVTLTQSTVSGNSTAGDAAHGGGIWANGTVTLIQSTVTQNTVAQGQEGGVFQADTVFNFPFSINGSIVAGNTAGSSGSDLRPDFGSTLTVNYSLIGVADGLTFAGNIGNLRGTFAAPLDPQLSPLLHHGGSTLTHALWPGSPAINAGDPSIAFNPGEFDQRGEPWMRVHGGRIDIGAFESQPNPLPGDYNFNGKVSAADYVMWRDTLGSTIDLRANGDDSNHVIDIADYGVWRANFGNTLGGGASSEERAASLSIAGGSQPPESEPQRTRSMGDSPVRETVPSQLGRANRPSHGSQARLLALLDLLDSLPEREKEAEHPEWDFSEEEREWEARDEVLAVCFPGITG